MSRECEAGKWFVAGKRFMAGRECVKGTGCGKGRAEPVAARTDVRRGNTAVKHTEAPEVTTTPVA